MMIRFEVRVHSPSMSVRRRVKNIATTILSEVLAGLGIFGYNIDWEPEEHSRTKPFSRIEGTIYTSEKLDREVTKTIDIVNGKVLVWLVPLD